MNHDKVAKYMNAQTTSPEYMLLFRGTRWDKGLSAEEIQKTMSQWVAWFERLSQEGKLKAGQPLTNEGRIVSGKKGRGTADGPFAESKEAIGGYFLLKVGTIDEAVEIAKACPALQYGLTVEVRPVAAQCAISELVNDQLAQANG